MTYRYICPACGDHSQIEITVTIGTRLHQKENGEFETNKFDALNQDEEWDDDSPAVCQGCGQTRKMFDFKNPDFKDDDDADVPHDGAG